MNPPRLWMLSGGRGSGKTTFCRLLAEEARTSGWDVAGLISPAVFEAGVKTGICVEDLRSGAGYPLACLAAAPGTPSTFDLPFGPWRFSASTFERGNQILQTCLPCDLLIVDEIGPLELLNGAGWASALEALRQPAYRLGVVVVRPELQELAEASLPVCARIELDDRLQLKTAAHAWWLERLHEDAA